MKKKKILFTGGGTAGHVVPNISIIDEINKDNFEILYIGSRHGIEKDLIRKKNIPYFQIFSGRLRRYCSHKNFIDIFKILIGIVQAFFIIRKIKPDLLFSKGAGVSFPVVIGAHLNKVPIIIHESDVTPGIANKLCFRFASKIITSFPETLDYLPNEISEHVGSPIRKEILEEPEKSFIKFNNNNPILLVFGSSLGSKVINDEIRKVVKDLVNDFNIIHLCGKGNLDDSLNDIENYKQFEYLDKEMPSVFHTADIVLSRAGSNAIFEMLALKKPNILIPLAKQILREEQIYNAKSFEKSGFSIVIQEEESNPELLISKIKELYRRKNEFIENMSKFNYKNSNKRIIDIINSF